ncbi:MAG: thermonuclease family protein, partial [Actinobacteria bacterium]|nr:thermonuclease family protein [Actinomycetota bacterium]
MRPVAPQLPRPSGHRRGELRSPVPQTASPVTPARTTTLPEHHVRARRRTASVGVPAVVTALALVLVACGSDRTSSSTGSGGRVAEERLDANAEVERVVDGDTIVADVRGSRERVRLIGIDTPESVKPNSPVECYGKEASAHTQELLPEGTR